MEKLSFVCQENWLFEKMMKKKKS